MKHVSEDPPRRTASCIQDIVRQLKMKQTERTKDSSERDTILNKAPTLTSQFTSTQYDFDLDAGFTLHVVAESLEAAEEGAGNFLEKLKEEKAKGRAARFLEPHDATRVPLAFFLRNRTAEGIGFWVTRFK